MSKLKRLFSKKKSKKANISEAFIGDFDIKEIEGPTNVKHDFHVGFENGDFVGLPPMWAMLLQKSKIRYGWVNIVNWEWRAILGVPASLLKSISCGVGRENEAILTIQLNLLFTPLQRS